MITVIIKLLLINYFVEACGPGWLKIGMSCYLMFDKDRTMNMTFDDAKTFCASHNARLPTFSNYTEYNLWNDMVASWGDFWLGYWYDRNRTSMTFTGFPSGQICDVGQTKKNDYLETSLDIEQGNCIVRLYLIDKKRLLYVHRNCNAYNRFACQIPKNPDDCPKIATTTTAMPETQTSPTPNATTEIETSTMSIVATAIQTSTIYSANTENATSTSIDKPIFENSDGIHSMKSTTKSHGKVLAKQHDSPSKGKQTIVYIIVPICVIGFLVVIIVVVAVVLMRRRARKKAADGAISSKLSNKPYPIYTFSSVSEATKMKSQPKTNQKSFHSSLQKTLDKSQRKSKVNSLQKTQQKTQQKTLLKTQQKAQPTMLEDMPEKNKKASMPYHDFSPTKPTINQKNGRKSTSKSRSQEAEEESDYETVKP